MGWCQLSNRKVGARRPSLIRSTTFQLIWGRLSDIFGRKIILMTCLTIFMVGDLLCGFSRTAIQLYIFRAIAGIGGGGINSLCMIIVSDIVSLKDRGKVRAVLLLNIVPRVHGCCCRSRIWGGKNPRARACR